LDREDPGSHLARQILETLAAFIREQSRPLVKEWNDEYPDAVIKEIHMPYRNDKGEFYVEQFNDYIGALEPAPEDIQAAFKIIVRSFTVEARPGFGEGWLNLSATWLVKIDMPGRSNLQKLNLAGAHMENMNLSKARMKGAELSGAHMESTDLAYAHLEDACLTAAYMEKAKLMSIHMEGADLRGAHIEGAFLIDAHMEKADLAGTYMQGAHITGAHLNLKRKQLTAARWDSTRPPINVPEHLLPLPHDGEGNPLKPDAGEEEEEEEEEEQ
jgi:hypothetical protein